MRYTAIVVFVCEVIVGVICDQHFDGSLGMSCDFNKYKQNGCEDNLGSVCNQTTNRCQCKPLNVVVLENRFCFPKTCPHNEYYDHNLSQCEPQRVASLNSNHNYCHHDFHCRGEHIHCLQMNGWNYRCECERGFLYDNNTQVCQRVIGFNGFCLRDKDCHMHDVTRLVCEEQSCRCAQGFSYNVEIDGCESIEKIKERDNQTRKMMYLFIGLGLFFGAALSLKFGTNSAASTQQMLLKRVVELRRQQQLEEQQQRLRRHTQGSDDNNDTCVDMTAIADEQAIDKEESA